jgi:hypothetical protein
MLRRVGAQFTCVPALVCLLAGLVPAADTQLQNALKTAGDNAPALRRAIQAVPDDLRPGVEFLVANMPAVDLAQMPESTLVANVRCAYQAWRTFPWAKQIPEETFLHYVLPYRVTQEPISDWRPMFLDSLTPVVAKCTAMTQAALEVNKWCGARVKYKPNAPRDQGPLPTLKSGWGRCEEMMIVHIDACRAVGIPAREAYTPYWPMTESNHAWSEAWIDGRWNYMGSCEPAPILNNAWFDKTVQRAALVMNVSFGVPRSETSFYRKEPNAAVINSTTSYTRTGILAVRVANGKRAVKAASVVVSVFNFGTLRPIARLVTDKEGTAAIAIGPGDYFVSAGTPTARAEQVVHIEPDAVREVRFDLAAPQSAPDRFWLWYKAVE